MKSALIYLHVYATLIYTGTRFKTSLLKIGGFYLFKNYTFNLYFIDNINLYRFVCLQSCTLVNYLA